MGQALLAEMKEERTMSNFVQAILNFILLPLHLVQEVMVVNKGLQKGGQGIGRGNLIAALVAVAVSGLCFWKVSLFSGGVAVATAALLLFLNRDSFLMIIRLSIIGGLSIFVPFILSFAGLIESGGAVFIVTALVMFLALSLSLGRVLEDRIS